eukprot:Gb_30184 [translate_table: standard]
MSTQWWKRSIHPVAPKTETKNYRVSEESRSWHWEDKGSKPRGERPCKSLQKPALKRRSPGEDGRGAERKRGGESREDLNYLSMRKRYYLFGAYPNIVSEWKDTNLWIKAFIYSNPAVSSPSYLFVC